ncbi:FAD-dependent oxidoreductase [Ferrovibrio terrae]|uniref:FAD-dependent oxidoreductase n=1 Tax=Ferrovibrio terrae TaxID=2594003 RepID=A0A516GW72_9PROT|nr:FAD-dependent oxidoreductase [Ferrovibrio terrae]QDO95778.1 FAD-dependent oxidoreductase [Ferrovibrio terrae]
MTRPDVDVAILGGGIAGLWLLARLKRAGYSALLIESAALGAGQTLASQGIIHGGLKYAIDLKLGQDSAALADMPARWRAALNDTGEIDLRGATLAAENHLFWARRTLASRVAGFFGSRLVRGRVEVLNQPAWPQALRDPDHVGAVYALDECVLDVPSLLTALAALHAGCIKAGKAQIEDRGDHVILDVAGRRIIAGHLISAAGAGNEALLSQLGLPAHAAQRRPLHQVLIGNAPAPLWAHCFDTSDKPRVTITTHRQKDGTLVWNVGGLIAENGVQQSETELIATARTEFATLLPKLDFSQSRFAGHRVDRAEGATESGHKPDGPVLQRKGRIMLAWPTKLALAPRLADLVLADLSAPSGHAQPDWADWSSPAIAPAPWETVSWR